MEKLDVSYKRIYLLLLLSEVEMKYLGIIYWEQDKTAQYWKQSSQKMHNGRKQTKKVDRILVHSISEYAISTSTK